MKSKSPGAYHSFLAMAGMYSNPYMDVYSDLTDNPKVKRVSQIRVKQKCFRPDCTNLRTGNKLYCSKECCELDKERLKRK